MAEKRLYLLAGFDPKTENQLADWQRLLTEAGFQGQQTNIFPRLTLADFPCGEEGMLRQKLPAIKSEPVPVAFSHIGFFDGGKVLFAAPDISLPLLALREQFSNAPYWTPHATLLIDEPEQTKDALALLQKAFVPLEGRLESLWLYEFQPPRFIAQTPLPPKELS